MGKEVPTMRSTTPIVGDCAEDLEKIIKVAQKTMLDMQKFDHGNIAAGIRTRKQLQIIRFGAKDLRAKIVRIRGERDAAKAESS